MGFQDWGPLTRPTMLITSMMAEDFSSRSFSHLLAGTQIETPQGQEQNLKYSSPAGFNGSNNSSISGNHLNDESKGSVDGPEPESGVVRGDVVRWVVVQVPVAMDETTHNTILYPAYSGPMVKTYSFTLDSFQQVSVAYLERNESVLLSAHTSARKMAMAEYAITMAFRDRQRVIYTLPLKPLRNKKYRELSHEFTDVGLMTSDVSMYLNASCLVMTTEILRGMLYRGFEVLKEVSWVIFDEIHI